MKLEKIIYRFMPAILSFLSVSQTNAATIISSSFIGANGSTNVTTSGFAGYGYMSDNAPSFLGIFGGATSQGDPARDLAWDELFRLNNTTDFADTTTPLVSSGGSYGAANVQLTELANLRTSSGASGWTFNSNNSYGGHNYGSSQNDGYSITFNDLGIGTFDINLYLDHAQTNRRFRIDHNLAGITGNTSMGSTTTIGNLNADTGASEFYYTIRVETTSVTDDLTLTVDS